MPPTKPSRNRLFRAALAIAGQTGKQFAEKRSVTNGHLWQVVNGTRTHDQLLADVDQFIDKHLISNSALVA